MKPTFALPVSAVLRDRRTDLPTRVGGVPYRRLPSKRIHGIAVHATPGPASAEAIALYQTTKVEGDPYPAIAYHFVVGADGVVEWCHDFEVEPWHAGVEGSLHYLSVCFPGSAEDGPSAEQLRVGRMLVLALRAHLGRPLEVVAHADLVQNVTGCPGAWWSSRRAELDGAIE